MTSRSKGAHEHPEALPWAIVSERFERSIKIFGEFDPWDGTKARAHRWNRERLIARLGFEEGQIMPHLTQQRLRLLRDF